MTTYFQHGDTDHYEVKVWKTVASRNALGNLSSITVKTELIAIEEDGDKEYDFRVEAEYIVEDGVAELADIGRREKGLGTTNIAEGIVPEAFVVLPAAEDAIQELPDVDELNPAAETLGRLIDAGEDAANRQDGDA